MDLQDNIQKKAVIKMNEKFQEHLEKRQEELKGPVHLQDFENMTKKQQKQQDKLIHDNLEKNILFVEDELYSVEMTTYAMKTGRDYNHNFIYEEAEQTVTMLNEEVAKNIKEFGEADIREHGLKKDELPIDGKINKAAKEAGWKDRGKEEKTLAEYKKKNEFADLNTVREMNTLNKQAAFYEMMKENIKNGVYDKELSHGKKLSEQEMKKKRSLGILTTAAPFMKFYKKGFLGLRIYDMDGNRIKTKSGEKSPEEYNKELISVLTLETRKGKLPEKDLEANREKVAGVLNKIAQELLDKKITEDMLTDEYLADHIGEMQQYVDKLNAFQNLTEVHDWYLAQKGDTDDLTADEATGQIFLNAMISKRITHVADQLNMFLDHHYAAHGMMQPVKSKFYKPGGVPGAFPDFSDNADYKTDESKKQSQKLLADTQKAKLDQDRKLYRNLKQGMIGHAFMVSVTMPDQTEEYKKNMKELRDNYGAKIKETSKALASLDKDHVIYSDWALDKTESSQKKMISLKEKSLKKFQNKRDKEKNDDLFYVTYDYLNDFKGTDTLMRVKNLMSKNSGMYMLFAPEIEHIFTRMFASVRHTAELCARKENINYQINRDKEFLNGDTDKSPFEMDNGSNVGVGLIQPPTAGLI